MDIEKIILLIFGTGLIAFLIIQSFKQLRERKYADFVGAVLVTAGFGTFLLSHLHHGIDGIFYGMLGFMFIGSGFLWFIITLIVRSVSEKTKLKKELP
ncbi:hypothetical protein ACSVDE_02635 [Pseudalkalibacillus sp. Hm43]|uniref:hypothetical protein n=1 Tax=Pseudalkalibacillus sp. Hm43 TaxID=3450742 RepID=UPI003F442B8D